MRVLSLLTIPAAAVTALAASAEDWRSRSIYQIVTDRFALGNGTTPQCNTGNKKYCGGDWQGIIKHLDYIQDMGFDAIWISPVSEQVNSTNDGDPYHGYWTGNLDNVNSHFGTEYDLKNLVSELHSREMYLMLDVNVNNMASNSTPANVSYLLPFMNETNYHPQCAIDGNSNQWQLENCWLTSDNVVLPDLNTESPLVINMLNEWVNGLVQTFNVDGLRIDSANYVEKEFWPAFAANASVFTIANVNNNDISYAAPYTNVLDSVFDYPGYFELTQTFTSSQGDLSALAQVAQDTQAKYKTGAFSTGSFIENHEQPRFQSLTQDQALVKNAIAWTFVADGMPVVYYGQEQGFSGSNEPGNHEALWLSGFNPNKPLVSFITSLNMGRKAAALGSTTFHSTQMKVLSSTVNTMAISKAPMLALLSNGGNSSTPAWNVTGTGYAPDTTLVDILTCNTITAGDSGNVATRSKDGMPLVFLPQSVVQNANLCGMKRPSTAVSASSRSFGLSWITTAFAIMFSIAIVL